MVSKNHGFLCSRMKLTTTQRKSNHLVVRLLVSVVPFVTHVRRSYVYQAMRISGAGDITAPISATRAGKLPQQVISKTAAHGYSSYGNQIGLATTYVREYFHPGFVAKRMELGAVVGAAPKENVVRENLKQVM